MCPFTMKMTTKMWLTHYKIVCIYPCLESLPGGHVPLCPPGWIRPWVDGLSPSGGRRSGVFYNNLMISILTYLKEAAIPMACGNDVALPACTSPWRHSAFHCCLDIFNLGIPGAGPPNLPEPAFDIWSTISSTVRRPIKSLTRSLNGKLVFWNG